MKTNLVDSKATLPNFKHQTDLKKKKIRPLSLQKSDGNSLPTKTLFRAQQQNEHPRKKKSLLSACPVKSQTLEAPKSHIN